MGKKKKKIDDENNNNNNKDNKTTKKRKKGTRKKHPKLRMVLKIMLITFILMAVIVGRNTRSYII